MKIISQKREGLGRPGALPDFRNLGVLLRVLLLVNLAAAGSVAILVEDVGHWPMAWIVQAGRVELPLFVLLLVLFALQPMLARSGRVSARVLLGVLVALVVAASFPLVADAADTLWRWLLWSLVVQAAVLHYFDHRSLKLSPALSEARLMALTARIRPHFLFNSLNGVLGVIRSEPRRAERALEELADLFRALMRENSELVPLADELELCRRYADLERLRLGERLSISWRVEPGLDDALVPPLMLQPLLENAVYHGIEPAGEAGEVIVDIRRRGAELCCVVDNPVFDMERHHAGNRMALDNIRERLALFFDLEAGLESERSGGRYRVRIHLPCRKRGA